MGRIAIAQQLDKIGFWWVAQQQLNDQIKLNSNGARNNSLTVR